MKPPKKLPWVYSAIRITPELELRSDSDGLLTAAVFWESVVEGSPQIIARSSEASFQREKPFQRVSIL